MKPNVNHNAIFEIADIIWKRKYNNFGNPYTTKKENELHTFHRREAC
jgi:hypothetical protein